jgi:hydroxymethylbilane synthase
MQRLKLGTRKSKLAMIQADIVSSLLKSQLGIDPEIVTFTTSGDKNKSSALYDVGGKGLFIKELEEALVKKEIDIAIHSLKDIPGVIDNRFEIVSMLEREDPRDVLVSLSAKTLSDLKPSDRIGTSSPRRIAYLKKIRPDLTPQLLRGNLDSRLEKIQKGEFDATLLAYAGIKRLYKDLDPNICNPISTEDIIPAVGQGVIALEVRKDDLTSKNICLQINHQETFDLVNVERAFLRTLEASCRTPAASYARRVGEEIEISFMLADDNWDNLRSKKILAKSLEEAEDLAISIAHELRVKN